MDFIPQRQEAQRHVQASASLGWQQSTLLLQCACEVRLDRQGHHSISLCLVAPLSDSAPTTQQSFLAGGKVAPQDQQQPNLEA